MLLETVPSQYAPNVAVQLTPVFETYWRFASERQRVFMKRAQGEPGPWTTDPILTDYKFTNAYRCLDRVSQYLIREVIYGKGNPALSDGWICSYAGGPGWEPICSDPKDMFFRIMLFKIFNKCETWDLFTEALGEEPSWKNYNFDRYDKILSDALRRKVTINSSAYMMSASGGWGQPRHHLYLRLLEKWMTDEVPEKIEQCGSMKAAFDILVPYKLMGNFLAYQYVTDLNYSPMVDWSEMEFTIPGPGALRGIQKCFDGVVWRKDWQYEDVIRYMAETQDEWCKEFKLDFQKIGENPTWKKIGACTGRPLQLIDIQNLFCETDKYSRHAHPDIKPQIKRRKKREPRIKAKFQANPTPIQYMFPPKWGITDLVAL